MVNFFLYFIVYLENPLDEEELAVERPVEEGLDVEVFTWSAQILREVIG